MSDHLKCLMIGAAGVGKSSLLKALPNAKLIAPEHHHQHHQANSRKETYLLDASHFHGELEKSQIEIQNIDISIETCLNDSDMFLNTLVLPSSSSQIINISNMDVIIFCFALDDINSFHLIRSKWDIYLKKMTKAKNSNAKKFILIGLKSDLVSGKHDGEDKKKKRSKNGVSSKKDAAIKVVYKKRSCSVNSVSSTSRLQSSSSKKKRIISESESPSTAAISNNSCKKFAKLIRAKFIKLSNMETSNEHIASFMDEMSTCLLKSSGCGHGGVPASTTMTFKRTSTFKSKLPKSISAPISTLVNRRSRKLIDVVDKENGANNENEGVKNGGGQDSSRFMEPSTTIENISLKKKLSQLLTGLGTYVVTCGSKHKSRKLINNNGGQPKSAAPAAAIKNSPLRNQANNLLKRKNKSWLLLGSDASLNSLTNEDEVFA